jgi:hypothetical protein
MTIYIESEHPYERAKRTDVEQDRAIALLVHDVVLEDLVIESSRLRRSERHIELGAQSNFHRASGRIF